MAKKNKKLTKINQKIKKYFNGDPFDVGVTRVGSQTLSELFSYLGIHDIEHTKTSLLKAIRILWSEPDSYIRRDILNFFENEDTIYYGDKQEKITVEKDDKIDSILNELDIKKEEEILLREYLQTLRTKKITPQRAESKLSHIRFELKKEAIQKNVDGIFDIDDSLQFNATFRYQIYEYHFHKILTLNTKPYDYQFLEEKTVEEIVSKIEKDKLHVSEQKQKNIDEFLQNIKEPHPYLSHEEIVKCLRTSPPQTNLKHYLIKTDILEKIIQNYLNLTTINVYDKELILETKTEIQLPYIKQKQNYQLTLHVELDSLLQTIWDGDELNFWEIFEQTQYEYEKNFLKELDELASQCNSYALLLHLNKEELYKKVYEHLLPMLPTNLHVSSKISRKVVKTFIYHIQEELAKRQKEELLARTIRDFKNLFPQARQMRRKLILHIGPTNSGKTYQAMQKLKEADTGYYLAPLRLLALEGFEDLKQSGVDVSLITGEEQIVDEMATHISSTIEMLNFEVDVDVCVIDEVQMIDDPQRGWAWANAIIGTPASEVIMTGSPNVKDAIIELANYLGEELEIIEFERKTPLVLLDKPTNPKDVEAGSAIIAFSRKDVLKLKQQFSKNFDVSVVYGNLSPEVRREEAKRFREHKTQILIATDAIAMGLNMPIKTILFSKANKFDGISQRDLLPTEVAQISGRAGRYGFNEVGYVGGLNYETLKIVKKNFNKELKTISTPFKVMANLEHIKLVSKILQEDSLSEILHFFTKNMKFNGPFRATNLEDMVEVAHILDNYDLSIETKFHLACAPLTLKSPYILGIFEHYVSSLSKQQPIPYNPPKLINRFAKTAQELLRAEDMIKEISLYLWLSYRFDDYFVDIEKVKNYRYILNNYIEESLKQKYFSRECNLCKSVIPMNSRHNICQRCFKKHYRGKKRVL